MTRAYSDMRLSIRLRTRLHKALGEEGSRSLLC